MSISAEGPAAAGRRLAGDLAMWFFILAELTVFGILILAFAVAQALQPALFQAGRAVLDASTGLALTLSLLTGGLFAAMALARVREDRRGGRRVLAAALVSACVALGRARRVRLPVPRLRRGPALAAGAVPGRARGAGRFHGAGADAQPADRRAVRRHGAGAGARRPARRDAPAGGRPGVGVRVCGPEAGRVSPPGGAGPGPGA